MAVVTNTIQVTQISAVPRSAFTFEQVWCLNNSIEDHWSLTPAFSPQCVWRTKVANRYCAILWVFIMRTCLQINFFLICHLAVSNGIWSSSATASYITRHTSIAKLVNRTVKRHWVSKTTFVNHPLEDQGDICLGITFRFVFCSPPVSQELVLGGMQMRVRAGS